MVKVTLGISDEHIDEVFNHPSIQKLSHDHCNFSYIEHPLIDYYSAWANNEFMGAFMVIQNTHFDYEVHMLLLPKSVKYMRMLSHLIIEELFKSADRITASIMEDIGTIKNLVKKIGFSYEGKKRNAYQKGGAFKDIYYYGLLKSEWRK